MKNHKSCGFVMTPEKKVYLQLCADNQHGFDLISEDQTFAGGLGASSKNWSHCSKTLAKKYLSEDEYVTLNYYLEEHLSGGEIEAYL